MKTQSQINQSILLKGKEYKIIGIDTYFLKSITDNNISWKSYTLLDIKGKKTWVSGPYNGCYYQWTLLSEKKFKEAATENPLNSKLTGIANIEFEGNFGFSTPYAELVWIDLNDHEYDCVAVERFLKQTKEKIIPMESYYNAGKILKDFII
jgi:hypothetical protein